MVGENIIIAGTGGGVGENYSGIRPRGSPIHGTGGEASGAVSIMRIENAALQEIKSGGGRRAARMGMLQIDHPDIEEFLSAKLDRNELNNFNISVWFDDDPEDFFNLVREKRELELRWNNQTLRTVLAEDLWIKIISNALKNGEPGVFNGYLANKMSNISYCRKLVATNPCVTGDTIIATLEGPKTFKELAESGKDVLVYSWHPETKRPVVRWMRHPHKTREVAKLLEVEFDSGLKVRCTYDHHFYSFRGNRVKAIDLKIGSSIRAFSMSQHRDGHLRVHGWNGPENKAIHQWVARMVWECYNGPVPSGKIIHHLDEDKYNNKIENLACITPIEHNSEHYVDRVLGGFHNKLEPHENAVTRVTNHKVIAVRESGYKAVYNGCVDDSHSYIILDPEPIVGVASGIVSANCGEQVMQNYSVCCLGNIVLSKMIKRKSKSQNILDHINWELLHKTVSMGIRFLDDVLDVTYYPLQNIKEESANTRRIGLGVMGLHHFLLLLGLKYSSPEGLDMVDKVMAFIKHAAYDASVALAIEKGVFPLYNSEGVMESGFIKTLKPSIRSKVEQHGLRNCAVLNIPPTGTTAITMGCTSGLEPMFAPASKRTFWDKDVRKSEIVLDPLYEEYLLAGLNTSHFESAADLSVRDHLAMLLVCQKHIDGSISKTVNIPQKEFDVESLSALYMEYVPQVKGLTIYPEGSREFTPLERIPEAEAIKYLKTGKATTEIIVQENCPDGSCSI